MWETSKRPAERRQETCSSITPVYWTGSSQPPKSIRRPPSFWCSSNSAVRLSMFRTLSPHLGASQRVEHEHLDRHGTHAAGNRADRAGELRDLVERDVAHELSV